MNIYIDVYVYIYNHKIIFLNALLISYVYNFPDSIYVITIKDCYANHVS